MDTNGPAGDDAGGTGGTSDDAGRTGGASDDLGEPGAEADRFAAVRERATDAIGEESVESVYVGLVHDDGDQEYYFGNRTDDAGDLRDAAANQLGMLVAVLAAQSEAGVEEVLALARERADRMDLR